MTTTPKTVLLTGASGVIGTALIPQLAGEQVIALTHRVAPCGPVEQVRGDLTRPRLGLDRDTYRQLAGRVDTVIHGAAQTDFAAGAAATAALNIGGVENILRFVADADAVLHYLSSAFVARRSPDAEHIGEAAADPRHYLASKRAAERLVRDAGVKATIIRPSVVIGDSRTGQITNFQGLHTLIVAGLRNLLPLLPMDADARIDFVPRDLVAAAVAGLVHHDVDGGQYWVTAGRAALTIRQLIDVTAAVARSVGMEPIVPRLVTTDMIDRLIRPVFIAPLPPADRRRFGDLLVMAALLAAEHPFTSTLAEMPDMQAVSTAQLQDALAASVRHIIRVKDLAPQALEVCA